MSNSVYIEAAAAGMCVDPRKATNSQIYDSMVAVLIVYGIIQGTHTRNILVDVKIRQCQGH